MADIRYTITASCVAIRPVFELTKNTHTSPLRASYGVSFVSILKKNDRVIKGLYCSMINYLSTEMNITKERNSARSVVDRFGNTNWIGPKLIAIYKYKYQCSLDLWKSWELNKRGRRWQRALGQESLYKTTVENVDHYQYNNTPYANTHYPVMEKNGKMLSVIHPLPMQYIPVSFLYKGNFIWREYGSNIKVQWHFNVSLLSNLSAVI